MVEKVKVPVLEGLYFTKGQQFEDLCRENKSLSKEEVKRLLDEGVQIGGILHYTQGGLVFYIKKT